METSGFVFLFIFVIIIMVHLYLNYIVSCSCRDNFTNSVPVSYVCPYGGNLIYNNKYCSEQTAPIDPTTKTCPKGYTKYNNNICAKSEYASSAVCPDGYKRKSTRYGMYCEN